MNQKTKDILPSVHEIEKLPLRAVVAYAASVARRICAQLHGAVAYDVLESALQGVESVSKTELLSEVDTGSIIHGAEAVVASYRASNREGDSQRNQLLLFSIVHASLAAMYAVLASNRHGLDFQHRKEKAVEAAHRATRQIKTLDPSVAEMIIQSARQEYDRLLQEFGEVASDDIGGPV
jgi:hypothetical protein